MAVRGRDKSTADERDVWIASTGRQESSHPAPGNSQISDGALAAERQSDGGKTEGRRRSGTDRDEATKHLADRDSDHTANTAPVNSRPHSNPSGHVVESVPKARDERRAGWKGVAPRSLRLRCLPAFRLTRRAASPSACRECAGSTTNPPRQPDPPSIGCGTAPKRLNATSTTPSGFS
jgi:hypothetical protein